MLHLVKCLHHKDYNKVHLYVEFDKDTFIHYIIFNCEKPLYLYGKLNKVEILTQFICFVRNDVNNPTTSRKDFFVKPCKPT